MKYRILLTNKRNGEEAEIIVPSHLPLEELSWRIKVALSLPVIDHCWHRFYSHGTAYVPWTIINAEQEILYECDLYVGRYRASDDIRMDRVFTVLHSVIVYVQDDGENDHIVHTVHCELMERIE